MKKLLLAVLLVVAVDGRAALVPPPARIPTIIVDTHDLYPDYRPAPPPWWPRWCRLPRFCWNQP